MKNNKFIPTIELLTMIVACCLQGLALLLLILGSTYCFGIRTSALNIVSFVFNIFKTSSATAITNVTELAIAIIYIILAILFIKRLFSGIKNTLVYKKKIDLRNELWHSTLNNCASTFMAYIFFCFLCNLMSRSKIEWYTLAFLIASGSLAIFSKIFWTFKKELSHSQNDPNIQKPNYNSLLQYIIRVLLLAGFFIYFLILFYQPWGNIMISDGKGATVTPATGSTIVYYIYVYILNDGLTIISISTLLCLMGKFVQVPVTSNELYSLSGKAKGIMIYNIILFVLNCVVRTLFIGDDMSELSPNILKTWFQISRPFYLPVLLLSIGLYIVLSIRNTSNTMKPNPSSPTENIQAAYEQAFNAERTQEK